MTRWPPGWPSGRASSWCESFGLTREATRLGDLFAESISEERA